MDGMVIGPVVHAVDRERIGAFVEATGDVPERWVGVAPPGYAAVLLFSVAADFLWHPSIADHVKTLIHIDQQFDYPSPLYEDDAVVITGSVDRIRERSGSYFATFTARAEVGDRRVLGSRSTFLMSDQAAAAPGRDEGEPPVDRRALVDEPAKRPLPAPGHRDVMTRSASRADLVRYAAASGDFNPLHWDHASARAAGLDGVVVHGLLANAWLCQHAAAFAEGEAPVAVIKCRFKNALRPGVAATSTATVAGGDGDVTVLALTLEAGETTIVTADATIRGVTP
jgi:acyl dehydratase